MELKGSCHCKAVSFSLESNEAFPYQKCWCQSCSKTQGLGTCNLGGKASSFKITSGEEFVKVYHKKQEDGSVSSHGRHFCSECGTHMWAFNADYPELIHPVATAIDTTLPAPPSEVHIMTEFRCRWLPPLEANSKNEVFPGYPTKSLEQWHKDAGLHGWKPPSANSD